MPSSDGEMTMTMCPGLSRWSVLLAAGSTLLAALSGCSSLGSSGPSARKINSVENAQEHGIAVVTLDGAQLSRLDALAASQSFLDVLGDFPADPTFIGPGDSVDVSMWEAPPAVLFGTAVPMSRDGGGSLVQGVNLPQQMVAADGRITVPFVGPVAVAGRQTRDVEREIAARLRAKAHDPQVVVRLAQNETRNVTVMGEVAASRRIALTPRGERLLDALASAGGSRQPVGKTMVQITRGTTTASMPLDKVIRDSRQNVRLRPGDVVTALYQPFSFTALGASNLNAEIPFEATGITLAQALGRVGGLRDDRADVRGVFIFRYERPEALDGAARVGPLTREGRVPVVYRLDMSEPAGLFLARNFVIDDKDIVYVSNAPLADLQKFMNMVSSATFSVIGITNAVQ